jgi:tetratricopeptide (TPR) repeat protein
VIPEGITGAELDRAVKAELRSLPRSLADLVAQHLVASGRFLDDDPERAYEHAKTARRLAARLGGVREAVAITAYLAEHYDEALTEFRAVRRMTGNHEVLAMMADCERALGRPEKALTLSREKQVKELSEATQIELLIVAAGARRDMGQTAAAIQTLEVPELTKRTRAEWLPRLRYAYADALEAAGRTEDALIWFHRAAGVDSEGDTDAAERAAQLEGLEFTDLAEDDEELDAYDDQDDDSGDDDELDARDDQDGSGDEPDEASTAYDEHDEHDDAKSQDDEQVGDADGEDAAELEAAVEDLVVDDALDGEVEPPAPKSEE